MCRVEQRFSQRVIAAEIGLSRNQLNRIERGEVSVRFRPAWEFCRFMDLNPLWLAFGDPYEQLGFAPGELSDVSEDGPFRPSMLSIAGEYSTYRSMEFRIQGPPNIRFSRIFDRPQKELVADSTVKHYLVHMGKRPLSWKQLRKRLADACREPGAKTALSRRFNISTAAVSQWLSGATAPKADTTLGLLRWVEEAEAKQQQSKSAGSATTRPAPKTPKGKIKPNEKNKSDQKKS